MAKTWILDSETKGTGAHIAPLEESTRKPSSEEGLALVQLERPNRPAEPAEAAPPLAFKIVDVRSAHVLVEGVGARETVDLLREIDSITDVRIYVWSGAVGRWRLLTFAEQRSLWKFRGARRDGAEATAGPS